MKELQNFQELQPAAPTVLIEGVKEHDVQAASPSEPKPKDSDNTEGLQVLRGYITSLTGGTGSTASSPLQSQCSPCVVSPEQANAGGGGGGSASSTSGPSSPLS